MLRIYCEAHHGAGGELCGDCDALRQYAEKRLEKCPYGEEKPACNYCPIHCYHKARREEIRTVMRFAGPRMFRRHPILSVFRLIDKKKTPPKRPE